MFLATETSNGFYKDGQFHRFYFIPLL